MPNRAKTITNTSTNLDFEAKLWATADALRDNMDAAEDKHVVLGLIISTISAATLPTTTTGESGE